MEMSPQTTRVSYKIFGFGPYKVDAWTIESLMVPSLLGALAKFSAIPIIYGVNLLTSHSFSGNCPSFCL